MKDFPPQPPTSRTKGLTAAEIKLSRQNHGDNLMTPAKPQAWWKLLLEKFEDPIIRILMVAAIISLIAGAFEGHYIESIGIVCAVLLSTGLAFINEYKASKEFDILNKVNDESPVRVLREGQFQQVPKCDIVVGDIVLLEIGEEIPADGAIIESMGMEVNQASLTGESESVSKHEFLNKGELPGAYASNVVLRSTLVTDGHGVIQVTAVGDHTEIGKTARAATEDTENETPLNQQLSSLGKAIGVLGLIIASGLFFALIARDSLSYKLVLTESQWIFSTLLFASVALALFRVWFPILLDGLHFLHIHPRLPKWLTDTSGKAWLSSFGSSVLLFALGAWILMGAGLLPNDPNVWITAEAAKSFLLYFMVAITLIVVSVPEGLPMSVTLSLAYSMRKMTRQNNLVRKMHACETIGAATVICSDKTGTLTMNNMSVHTACFSALSSEKKQSFLPILCEAVAANSTANLSIVDNAVETLGNATEGAMLKWLRQMGLDYLRSRQQFETTGQLTFSTERKFMASVGNSPLLEGVILYAKGAPEVILSRCTQWMGPEGAHPFLDDEKPRILSELAEYQRKGMRALGIALRHLEKSPLSDDIEKESQNLIWLGYFAIQDPVRPEVPSAMHACQEAGVSVKIVTGDNKETACQIGREIGLFPETGEINPRYILTGPEFEALSDDALRECIMDMKVLSRARPMDKQRLVKTLQALGQVVAVTGDGTNDAPALNYADVGLSMGKTGTSVAKEASDIVILDDSFSSIVNAVKWGRSLYWNIQKFIVFQLTVNVAALGVALIGPFIGINLPLTVTQMLWVNLIMDTFAALALATDPPSNSVMKNKPRAKSAFIITPSMARWIFGFGVTFIILLIGMILTIQQDGITPKELTLLFTSFVLLQFWNLFNARVWGSHHSAFSGIGKNPWFIGISLFILLGQFLAVQWGGGIFRTVPLSITDWTIIIVATASVLVTGEIIRFIQRLKNPSSTEES